MILAESCLRSSKNKADPLRESDGDMRDKRESGSILELSEFEYCIRAQRLHDQQRR